MTFYFLERKNWALGKLCQIVYGPQTQMEMLPWRRASENFDFYPKMGVVPVFKNRKKGSLALHPTPTVGL